jgi:hypothetical protein
MAIPNPLEYAMRMLSPSSSRAEERRRVVRRGEFVEGWTHEQLHDIVSDHVDNWLLNPIEPADAGIRKVARHAGVSARDLRLYHEEGSHATDLNVRRYMEIQVDGASTDQLAQYAVLSHLIQDPDDPNA